MKHSSETESFSVSKVCFDFNSPALKNCSQYFEHAVLQRNFLKVDFLIAILI